MNRREFIAAVGAVSVAGCSEGDDDATETGPADRETTPSATRSPTPSPTRSPTPTPTIHTSDVLEDLAAPAVGAADAPVRVTAYDDFACPHCRAFNLNVVPNVREFVSEGTVRFAHVDFPIPVSEWSVPVASAAREVYEQATAEAYFEYSHALFEAQRDYSYDKVASLAGSLARPMTVALGETTSHRLTAVSRSASTRESDPWPARSLTSRGSEGSRSPTGGSPASPVAAPSAADPGWSPMSAVL